MTKEIRLTQGKFALVDDDDFERLNQFKWCTSSNGYAMRNVGHWPHQSPLFMHHDILSIKKGKQTDHINGNKLDNRKANLREATGFENHWNTKKHIDNTSGFKGVTWHKVARKWAVRIQQYGKPMYLGLFTTAEEAAHAYDKRARELFGEYARTNFPTQIIK